MKYYFNTDQAISDLKSEGVLFLTLLEVLPNKNGRDVEIWNCVKQLDMSEKGKSWKDAFLLKSADAYELIEEALSPVPAVQIYFNNNLISKK